MTRWQFLALSIGVVLWTDVRADSLPEFAFKIVMFLCWLYCTFLGYMQAPLSRRD